MHILLYAFCEIISAWNDICNIHFVNFVKNK